MVSLYGRVLSAHAPGERYATVLCQEMFLAGQYAEAEAEIEQIVHDKPEEFILNLLKVSLLHSISTSIKIYLFFKGITLSLGNLPQITKLSGSWLLLSFLNHAGDFTFSPPISLHIY